MFSLLVSDPNTVGLNQSGSGSNTSATRRLQSFLNVFYCMPLGKDLVYADLYKTRLQYILFCTVDLETEQFCRDLETGEHLL
jgi:hypothetical protein